MKVLVTGGAGFIGSHLVEALLQKNEVVVFDNFSTGKKANLRKAWKNIKVINGDIRDLSQVTKATKGIARVCHLAAIPRIGRSIKQPLLSNQVNIDGTLNVLMAARKAGIERVVFASSSSVYGPEGLPKIEDQPCNPISPYSLQKLTGEGYARIFNEIYGLNTVVLRYFNAFGPRQDLKSEYALVIPKFIHLIKNKIRPEIYGDGNQSRDFTYIDNIINGTILALESKAALGQTINLATGNRVSINQLVRIINKKTGQNIKPIYRALRPGELKHTQGSIEKAKRLLKYSPQIKFNEGIDRIIDLY